MYTIDSSLIFKRYQHVGIRKANMKPCEPNAKPFRHSAKTGGPNANPGGPNASQCNIVYIGSSGIGIAFATCVDFMLFVSISFALGSKCKHKLWWNTGFRLYGGR